MESTLELLTPTDATPDLATLERADMPAIWNGFREQALALKTTAETLVVTEANQKSQMAIARQTRLALRQIRVAVEHKRVELKEEIVQRGRGIDAAAGELKAFITPLESRLEEQEKFALRQEEKRRADLKAEREAKLAPFEVNTSFYNLAEMPEGDFLQLVATQETVRDAKIEAARKAEQERIEAETARVAKEKADEEERERTRQENARLKVEAIERERAAKLERERAERERMEAAAALEKERQRVEAEKQAAAEHARKEREAAELKALREREAAGRKAAAELAAQRAEAERQQAERDRADAIERARIQRVAEIERQAREKAENELAAARKLEAEKQAKVEAERKAAEKAARDAAKAPDKAKLLYYAATFNAVPTPTMNTLEGRVALNEIIHAVTTLAETIEDRANAL